MEITMHKAKTSLSQLVRIAPKVLLPGGGSKSSEKDTLRQK